MKRSPVKRMPKQAKCASQSIDCVWNTWMRKGFRCRPLIIRLSNVRAMTLLIGGRSDGTVIFFKILYKIFSWWNPKSSMGVFQRIANRNEKRTFALCSANTVLPTSIACCALFTCKSISREEQGRWNENDHEHYFALAF